MTRATARRLATSWKFWAGLLLVVAVVAIEVSVLVGLLPKSWTGIVIAVAVGLPLYDYGKRLRTKMLTR